MQHHHELRHVAVLSCRELATVETNLKSAYSLVPSLSLDDSSTIGNKKRRGGVRSAKEKCSIRAGPIFHLPVDLGKKKGWPEDQPAVPRGSAFLVKPNYCHDF